MSKLSNYTLNKVVLERRKVQAQEFLSGHSLQSIKIDEIRESVIEGLLVKLRTEILAEVEPKQLYVAMFKMHKNWWEWFKDDVFSKRLKAIFPVKYISVKKYLTIHREAWYPKLNRIFPDCGNVVFKDYIDDEKEIRNT